MEKINEPCFAFARTGACMKGDSCEYLHANEREPCKYFPLGICKKGDQCTFSHVSKPLEWRGGPKESGTPAHSTRDTLTAGQQRTSSYKSPSNTQAAFQSWKRNIPYNAADARSLPAPALKAFFAQALELASGEAGVTQEVVTELASDGGLKRIGELVNRPFDTFTDRVLMSAFSDQIIPFFKLLSLKNVDRSALLESRVTQIYTYLFSPNGQRAVSLFRAAAKYLSDLIETTAPDTGSVAVGIDCSLAVLCKLIEMHASAQISEPFQQITEAFATLVEPSSDEGEPLSRPALRSLRKIQQRLNIGQNIPTASKTAFVGEKPTFEAPRDPPGALSDDGPRHDNDHASVRDIKILPTLGEISASRNEYLPSFDPTEWHIEGVAGLFDRQFRLVREDTVGQLRDAAKFELERLQDPIGAIVHKDKKQQHGARTFVYHNVRFEGFGFDSFKGLEFAVSFDQPFEFRRADEAHRSRMWADSKRLGHDALVCLIDAAGAATFMMVSLPPPPGLKAKTHSLHKQYPRAADIARGCAVIRFVDYHADSAKQVMGFFDSNQRGAHMSLVEFPGVLVPAFYPTLTALQKMSGTLDLPFADIVMQAPKDNNVVSPPAYATEPGFRFSLKAVSTNDALTLGVDKNGDLIDFDMAAFKDSTSLDSGQAKALISSLTRSFAITQGPPGTGKSYTGVELVRVLLDNKRRGDFGPIILVSYTNHALDQMLEHLLDAGVQQVIRIGSRSKSERLTELNLWTVAEKVASTTKTERSDRWRLMSTIQSEGKQIEVTLTELHQTGHQPSIEQYLARINPKQGDQLFKLIDQDGFETVDHHPESRLRRWLRGELYPPHIAPNVARPIDELLEADVRDLSLPERTILHYHCVVDIKHELRDRLARSLQAYTDAKNQLELVRAELNLRVLSKANVIGLTTSGLAKNLTLLRKLSSKVLVAEEAGEVQEAHLLTALLPGLEHVMLIGDQLQLRPQVQNYTLSSESLEGRQYCLDYSLFERLVNPLTNAQPLPFSTLSTQRRMHPSIAELIRSTLYPELIDAPNVVEYPEVSGFRRRLFWLNHDHEEDQHGIDAHVTSKTNQWEADMTVALVRHLVRQGIYKPSEIAVLTPYLGQIRLLRDRLVTFYEITLSEGDAIELGEASDEDDTQEDGRSDNGDPPNNKALTSKIARGTLMDAVRLSTVDNFQGEEAKVVVISLVRCNEQHNPGFLRTENRCNVLLSRAKHGMYIIGNAQTACTVPMWEKVLSILQPDNVGYKLELCCPRHPDKIMEVAEPDDVYNIAPAGGCQEPCARQLSCGHSCVQLCHSDLLHDQVFCLKDCMRPLKGCEHLCPRRCSDECVAQCEVKITDWSLTLECGHLLSDPRCWQVQQLDKLVCNELVLKTISGCDHSVLLPCSVDEKDPSYNCHADCLASLPCGHTCTKPCFKCNKRVKGTIASEGHGNCTNACDRDFELCKHSCPKTCHHGDPCPPCDAACDVHCSHSKCSKVCNEPCVPCAEEVCASQCEHAHCQMPCGAPCDWVPCSKRCSKYLACGCQCPSVCGEVCPKRSVRYAQPIAS